MSNISDLIKEHTVVVDEGSGVLIQPMTGEYSYILTAKHNILVDYEDSESATKVLADITITTISGDNLQVNDIYRHQSLDIAVIRIDCYKTELKIYPYQGHLSSVDDIWLYGYPGRLRLKSPLVKEWIEKYDLVLHESSLSTVTFRNRESALYVEVKGFSGGGIFYVNEIKGQYFLAGIENKMSSHGEYVDRIVGIPIVAFDGLLKENNLAPLKPLHLAGFKYLSDQILPEKYYEHLADFEWNDFLHVINLLKTILKDQVENINISPLDILKNDIQNLKVNNQDIADLENKELWGALLELMILNSLKDNENYDDFELNTDINRLLKKYRIIYINSDKGWKANYEAIVTTKIENLDEDGKVIVIVGRGASLGVEAFIPKESLLHVVDSISNANGKYNDIDNALYNNPIRYPVIDWLSLHHQCLFVVGKEFMSSRFRDDNIKLLKQKYQPYLDAQGHDNG